MEETKVFKVGETVPAAGRYVCTVCGFVVEYLEKHLEYGVTFPECPVCKAGAVEGGPKKPEEEFWQYLG